MELDKIDIEYYKNRIYIQKELYQGQIQNQMQHIKGQ